MKLTFETLQECLSSYEIIDSDIQDNNEKKACVIFKNIRSFKKWNVAPLSDLNIFTGPNSSGKSTLVSIISNIRRSKIVSYMESVEASSKLPCFIGFSIGWTEFKKESNYREYDNISSSISWKYLINLIDEFRNSEINDLPNTPNRITFIAESPGVDCFKLYTFVDQELVGFFKIDDYAGDIFFRIKDSFWEKLYSQEFSKKITTSIKHLPSLRRKCKLNRLVVGNQTINSADYVVELILGKEFNFEDGLMIRFGDSHLNEDISEISHVIISLYIIFFKILQIAEEYSGETLPSIRPISSKQQLHYKFEFSSYSRLKEQNSADSTPSFKQLALSIAQDILDLEKYATLIANYSWNNGTKKLSEINDWQKKY
jgi:energy-coupling factor transporter ATP-binding protein EcfA2